MRFSCITFGSPPVVTPDISETWKLLRRDEENSILGLTLAFVNEGDLVPRADRDYVLSIKRLLDVEGLEAEKEADPMPLWHLPLATVAMIGDIVVMKKERSADQEPTYSSRLISSQEFSSLLFCNKDAHHMDVYLSNIFKLNERKI